MIESLSLYKYLYPYVSGCSGFIRSNGLMLLEYDILVFVSNDQAVISYLKLPKPVDAIVILPLHTFYEVKDNPDQLLEKGSFYGSYGKYIELSNLFHLYYDRLSVEAPIYQEDITVLPDAQDKILSKTPDYIKFTYQGYQYNIMVCKPLLPINKGDECNISLYDIFGDWTRLVQYNITKKKLKTILSIISREIMIGPVG